MNKDNVLNKNIINKLIKSALEARKAAYVPYSHFAVGAALLTVDGTIIKGCNIENASYTPSNCAERTAFFKAVSEGFKDFTAIAVTGDYMDREPTQYCAPCGVCRQVMIEFCDPDSFIVIIAKKENDYREYKLKDILPLGFSPKNLKID